MAADVLAATLARPSARDLLVERARIPNVEGIPKLFEIGLRHGFSVVSAHRDLTVLHHGGCFGRRLAVSRGARMDRVLLQLVGL